jgi:hypothetical protein
MLSSGVLRRVAPVRTDDSEESIASIIMVTRIGDLGTMLAVTSKRNTLRLVTANVVPSSPILSHPGDGGDTFLRNVDSSKSHTAS